MPVSLNQIGKASPPSAADDYLNAPFANAKHCISPAGLFSLVGNNFPNWIVYYIAGMFHFWQTDLSL